MKILIVDVETSPNIAYVWGAWKQNISIKQMIESTYLLSFSAKWLGEEKIIYVENRHNDEKELVSCLLDLLDEADIVVAHNAIKFDIPIIQGRAAVLGFSPPSPFKVIDTLKSAKKHFKFPHNSLEYLCDVFGCSKKLSHKKFPGFELWLECLKGNDEAWEEMMEYNIQDVVCLEELYLKMRPWMHPHPNVANFKEDGNMCCPKCGSDHVVRRGYYHTQTMKYQRFRCKDCGGWGRERFSARDRGARKDMLTGV